MREKKKEMRERGREGRRDRLKYQFNVSLERERERCWKRQLAVGERRFLHHVIWPSLTSFLSLSIFFSYSRLSFLFLPHSFSPFFLHQLFRSWKEEKERKKTKGQFSHRHRYSKWMNRQSDTHSLPLILTHSLSLSHTLPLSLILTHFLSLSFTLIVTQWSFTPALIHEYSHHQQCFVYIELEYTQRERERQREEERERESREGEGVSKHTWVTNVSIFSHTDALFLRERRERIFRRGRRGRKRAARIVIISSYARKTNLTML